MFPLSRPVQRNAWLLLAIGIFLIGTIVSAYRIYQTQNALFWSYRTGTWLVVEAQNEFQNTVAAAKNFRIAATQATLDELKVRFDIFWSRVPLMLDSDEGTDIRRIGAILDNGRQIEAALPILERDLALATVGDARSLDQFERDLSPLGPLFKEMTRVVLVQDELRYGSGKLLKDMGWTIAAFLLAMGAGVALIIGNLISTRRIRMLLEQREAIGRAHSTQLQAIESSGEGIAMFDARGRLGYSNEAFHHLIEDDFTRTLNLQSWRTFLAPKSAMILVKGLRQSGAQRTWKGELMGLTLGGKQRCWEAHVVRRSEGGHVAVIRDLTDRKAAEEERNMLQQQLHRVEKMDAIGRLAGGVAHDFNNILAAITGFGSMLDLDLKDRPEEQAMAQQILTAAERDKELVQSIMTFSRTDQAEQSLVNVGDVCREAATIAAVSIQGPAVFETAVEPGALHVVGSATQISRAVVNLCINARDALEGNRGTVRLEVSRVEIDGGRSNGMRALGPAAREREIVKFEALSPDHSRAWIGILDPAPAHHARIRVTDNGCGISRAVMEKMFDPFFTTKDVGRGTGLGLASVLGIVKSHAGAIAVDSTVGVGTTFDILLPLRAEPATKTQAGPTPAPTASLADMHVLVVDDDQAAGRALATILEKIGCDVSECSSAAQALEVIADEPDWFDVVMTDLSMPEMTGLDLSQKLRERGFRRPLVLVSGRLRDALYEDRVRLGIRHVIAKPFTVGEVAAVVWAVAGERQKDGEPAAEISRKATA